MKSGFALLAMLALARIGLAEPAPDVCRYGTLQVPATAPLGTTASSSTSALAVYYAVPTDVPYNPAVLARIKRATADILAWYQCATGGLTWTLAFPETVRVYHASQNRQYYKDNGDWWGSLPAEMQYAGAPIWSSGTVCAIWAHGAGWWAGAAQWCGVDCGLALLGVECFPEFNNPAYSGGTCPGGGGVAAWPCTPEGAYAHELGHTVGLPHPADVPATSAVASHSIMQTHWNYPSYAVGDESPWGFLTLERQTIASNPFMSQGVSLVQMRSACDVVNLPDLGGRPEAGFVRTEGTPAWRFAATNTSSGAARSYWTFGDSSSSSNTDPTHDYLRGGTYLVVLRATATNGMMDTTLAWMAPTADVPVGVKASDVQLSSGRPNPFGGSTAVVFELPDDGVVQLTIHAVDGRLVRTLATGWWSAGPHRVGWDGRDDRDRLAAPGVYYCRLLVGGRALSRALVMTR